MELNLLVTLINIAKSFYESQYIYILDLQLPNLCSYCVIKLCQNYNYYYNYKISIAQVFFISYNKKQ